MMCYLLNEEKLSVLDLVISSHNKHKVEELKALFVGESVTVCTIYDVLKNCPDFIEDGTTFEENAAKKLKNLPLVENRVYLSDDSGLEVACLGGAPGIYSARYAGEGATSAQMCSKILRDIHGAHDRAARFVCVIALLSHQGLYTFRGHVDGVLAPEMRGNQGFGYDPIFIPNTYTQTYAELGETVKEKTSHRAKALAQAKHYLKVLYG
jgi:XTP/dITP diphosphohydrolase